MDEKQRTKVLGGVLAVVLGFGLVRPDKLLLEPVRKAEKDYAATSGTFDREEAKQMELMVARNRIEQGRKSSLPPRISDAQRLYQTWITNLAEQCKFATLQVTPGGTLPLKGQYSTVDVIVEAETDLPGLSRFLHLFDQADLMHRVSSLDIESTGASGNPRIEVKLTAEGLSVTGSPEKSDVFARTRLPEAITADATEVVVAEAADFPKTVPFRAQLGREMVMVTEIDPKSNNKWTVERGQDGTKAVEHPVDDVVQLFPIAPVKQQVAFSDYESLLNASPFTKPAIPKTYSPRLASVADKTVAPGEVVEMTAKAEDINPDVGSPLFGLSEPIDGMTLDAETGQFKWEIPEDVEPKKYITTFILTQKNNPELKVEKQVAITVQRPNGDPSVSVPEKAIVVLGREFTLDATAEDDGGEESLKFSLDGEVPEGLKIDESSGQLSWNPPKTFKPGEYQVTVKVTDGGTPEKSATASVALTVQDDDAVLTRFTGSVALDGQQVAWFRNMATKDRPELRIGDNVVAAEINAKLTEIDKRHVLLTDAEGVWKLNLGDNLRERVLIEPAAKPTPETSPEVEPAKLQTSAPVEKTEEPVAENADYEKDPPPAEAPVEAVKGEVPAEEPAAG